MPISGTDPALTVARLGVMRLGGSRLGYYQPTPLVRIDGVDRADHVRWSGLTIRDELFGDPNIATMRVEGFTPVKLRTVQIGLGDLDAGALEFNGRIQQTTQVSEEAPANVAFDLTCVSNEWLLNRLKVNAQYPSTMSASLVVEDVLERFAPEFAFDVEAGLPALEGGITFTNEDVTAALDRVADRLGAVWVLGADDVVHFAHDLSEAATAIASHDSIRNLSWSEDASQMFTRVWSEGGGASALAPVEAGATSIPVEDAVWYRDEGGYLQAGSQRVTYAGKSAGGSGALVGTGVVPTSAPVLNAEIGSGLSTGLYKYKVTFTTAAGETLPGPETAPLAINAGILADTPTTIGTASAVNLGTWSGPDIDVEYRYKYTFYGSGLESLPSPASNAAVPTMPPNPDKKVLHMTRAGVQDGPAERRWYRTEGGGSTYYLLTGPEEGFYGFAGDGWYDIYGDISGFLNTSVQPPTASTLKRARIGVNNIPVSSNPGVTGRRLYRTEANGSTFKLVATIANNSATGYTDTTPDGSLGAAPPTADTSGLTASAGEVVAGATAATLTSTTPFEDAGGWARSGAVVFRYSGKSATQLTGIPSSGAGAITVTIQDGAEVVALPMLVGVPASGDGALEAALAQGEDVNVLARCDDEAAQAALAEFLYGEGADPALGIRETHIQDSRLSFEEAEARGYARLAIVKDPIVSASYETRDRTHRSGRQVQIALAPPTDVAGTFRIQSVTISEFDEEGAEWPWRQVSASSRRFTLEAILRAVKATR